MVMPPPIRPTFEHPLELTEAQTIAALSAAFEADRVHPFQIQGKHILVTVPPAARHFWSPYLSMEVDEREHGTVLHGRFSPKPTIWTGFMLSYIALTTAGCFGLMFGGSQMIVGHSPALAFLLAVFFLLAALGMYLASQIGQKLARAQMAELHTLILTALKIDSAGGVGEGVAGGVGVVGVAGVAGGSRSDSVGEPSSVGFG